MEQKTPQYPTRESSRSAGEEPRGRASYGELIAETVHAQGAVTIVQMDPTGASISKIAAAGAIPSGNVPPMSAHSGVSATVAKRAGSVGGTETAADAGTCVGVTPCCGAGGVGGTTGAAAA